MAEQPGVGVGTQRQLELFKTHYSDILRAVTDACMFGAELFSRGLISDLEWKNARSSGQFSDVMCTMLDSVYTRLSVGGASFDAFMEVLMKEPQTADIAQSMKDSLDVQHTAPLVPRQRMNLSIDIQTPPTKRLCLLPSIMDHFTHEEDCTPSSTVADPVERDSAQTGGMATQTGGVAEMMSLLEDQEEGSGDIDSIPRSLSLLQPTGALKTRSHARIYTKLFRMAWGGEDQEAMSFVRSLRRQPSVSLDLKVVCMEVVHTVNSERDLKMLLSALAYTDRAECQNKTILKCRLHRRIAGLHYRNGDLEDAEEHLVTATQLAEQLSPDIDTVYTLRLNALMLFEQYKDGKDEKSRRGAEKYFQMAMDHVRRLPDSKRLVTERVKVSKALFHLDMLRLYTDLSKSEEAIEQLEYRARDTLNDVDETYLTDGDRAFYYSTQAQLKLNGGVELVEAEELATRAVQLSESCGLSGGLTHRKGSEVIRRVRELRGQESTQTTKS